MLIVDDNATNRLILDEMLTNWGIETSCVEGVDQAIDSLRRAREVGKGYDLVLSDVHMPDKDGFALASEIRNDEKLAGAVIMMLTSGDRSEDVPTVPRIRSVRLHSKADQAVRVVRFSGRRVGN